MTGPHVPVSLSVIVPAYNEAAFLADAVEEFHEEIARRVDQCELIVIDDGSDDETYRIAKDLEKRFPSVVVHRNETNRGVGQAFERGLALARHEYVTILPSDREWIGWEFLTCLRQYQRADVIIPRPARSARAWHRKLLSVAYIQAMNRLFGYRLNVYNTAYILKTELARSVKIRSTGYAFQAEFLIQLLDRGHSYYETPEVALRPIRRRGGRALRIGSWIEVARTVWRMWVRMRLRRGV